MFIPNQVHITYNAVMPNGKRFSEQTKSNAVSTEILTYSVLKTVGSDKTRAKAGENVRNTLTVTNHSATKLLDNFFTVSQPNGANFVAGSVKINGIAQPSYDPIKGFTLPDLLPDETVVIEYEFKAEEPSTAPVTHFGTLQYTVTDPARGSIRYSEQTDPLSFNVISDSTDTEDRIEAVTPNGIDPRIYYEINCDCNCRDCFDRCEFYCDCFMR